MNSDEIMMLAKKHHITDAYEYGSGVSDEDVVAFFNAVLQTKQAELTDEEIAVIGDKCFRTMSYELWVQTNEFARAILRKAQEADKIESLGTVNIGGVHFRNGKEVK